MRVWIRSEDPLRHAFVFLLHPSYHDTLISFHLYLLMRYVDSSPYFFCASETVSELANLIWVATANTAPHSILALTDTPPDPDDDAHAGIISAKLDISITARLPPRSLVALLR